MNEIINKESILTTVPELKENEAAISRLATFFNSKAQEAIGNEVRTNTKNLLDGLDNAFVSKGYVKNNGEKTTDFVLRILGEEAETKTKYQNEIADYKAKNPEKRTIELSSEIEKLKKELADNSKIYESKINEINESARKELKKAKLNNLFSTIPVDSNRNERAIKALKDITINEIFDSVDFTDNGDVILKDPKTGATLLDTENQNQPFSFQSYLQKRTAFADVMILQSNKAGLPPAENTDKKEPKAVNKLTYNEFVKANGGKHTREIQVAYEKYKNE